MNVFTVKKTRNGWEGGLINDKSSRVKDQNKKKVIRKIFEMAQHRLPAEVVIQDY